jgi:pyridoxine 4-dehydrogenase
MAQVALNWCIAKGAIPIPGAKTVAQAEQNIGALGWSIDAGEVAELDQAAARVPKTMVQNNFQTR